MLWTLDELAIRRAGRPILQGVSLTLQAPGVLVLLGPSGAGKTTLLRLIAGFEQPDRGTITHDGQPWNAQVPPRARRLGYAPQAPALTPHWTAREQLQIALQADRLPIAEITERCNELLTLLELNAVADQQIRTLSGGERRRVGVARALVRRTPLLLLDEPLAELDRPLRERLLPRLRQWFSQQQSTILWVTHDHSEAEALDADVTLLIAGRIEYRGPVRPAEPTSLSVEVREWLACR